MQGGVDSGNYANFPTAFSNTNYTIVAMDNVGDIAGIHSRNTSSAFIPIGGSGTLFWVAFGY